MHIFDIDASSSQLSAIQFGQGSALADAEHVLLWVHATGLNARTYRLLLEQLAIDIPQEMAIVAVDQRGHGLSRAPLKLPLTNWDIFAQDIAAIVTDLHAQGKKVHLAGHSMGGWVSLRAALDAGNTGNTGQVVKSVYVCDPVVMTSSMQRRAFWMQKLPWFIRRTLIKSHPMVVAAQRRRRSFESKQAMYERYHNRGVFTGWPDQALLDYIEGGTEQDPEDQSAVRLTCDPFTEAAVFGSSAANLSWPDFFQLQSPVRITRASVGSTMPAIMAEQMVQKQQAEHLQVDNSFHMFPIANHEFIAADLGQWLTAKL